MIRIALLGCGTVGLAVARRLLEDCESLSLRAGCPIQLARVLVRDIHRDRGIDPALLTDRFEDIAQDGSIDIAIELLGGLEPARSHVERLLARGVDVVTANKTLLAHAGPHLHDLAACCGARLAGEASVGGAAPVLSTLRGLQADHVESIVGIVSGSCNFIVTEMQRHGASFDDAVRQAQRRGLLEPDPGADLSLRDAVEKLCVMGHAIGWRLSPDQIQRRGIEHLHRDDIHAARELGLILRCVVELDRHVARVGPALLAADHPLASVDGTDNALIISTRHSGELHVRGVGAGPAPTAATVLGEVVNVVRQGGGPVFAETSAPRAHNLGRSLPHAIRCRASPRDRPDRILNDLAREGIEIARVEWRSGGFVVLTGPIEERALRAAIRSTGLANRLAFCAPCLVSRRSCPPCEAEAALTPLASRSIPAAV